MAKAGLTKSEWSMFVRLIQKATNSNLYRMDEMLQKEIRLSESAIAEGFEPRR